jgi:hypothetical protein
MAAKPLPQNARITALCESHRSRRLVMVTESSGHFDWLQQKSGIIQPT